jgi:hypothetical protein
VKVLDKMRCDFFLCVNFSDFEGFWMSDSVCHNELIIFSLVFVQLLSISVLFSQLSSLLWL